jgi:hypothetical protein
MTANSTLNAVGFADAARNYRQHALTISLRNDNREAPLQRRLGVRLITNNEPEDPNGLKLIPAVTIDEHASKYELTADGFSFTLDRDIRPYGGSVASPNVWYYQENEFASQWDRPPFTLPKHPFQNELRLNEEEGRYSPTKAKYFDFRQDHSKDHPSQFLSELDLSSKPLQWSRFDSRPELTGEDFRKFGVIYIEFRNAEDQPVVNPLFEGIEVPSRFGHYFVFDNSRSRAHISADLLTQARKIHPDIEVEISDYEGPPMRRLSLILPLGWSYNRPQCYMDKFYLNEGGYQEDTSAHNDGKTRLYQEEIEQHNYGQGVSGVQLGTDGLSREYSQEPAIPFPFPAKYLYPLVADNVIIPWGAEVNLEESDYTVEVTVPVTAYKYDAEREWQVYADLRTVPTAGDVALKEAKWLLTTGEGAEAVTTELSAYFVRYVSGALPPEDGGMPMGAVQTSSIFNVPDLPYIDRTPVKNAIAQMDGVGEIQMRVTPPPIDGHGYSPFVDIKPVEAKLKLTFHRPMIDDRFEFFMGDDAELQAAISMLPGFPKGMIPPPGQTLVTRTATGEPGNIGYAIEFTSDLAFNWDEGFATVGVYIGKTIVEEIVDLLADSTYDQELGYDFRGVWTDLPVEQFLSFIRPNGSILLPVRLGTLMNEINTEMDRFSFVVGFLPNTMQPGPVPDVVFELRAGVQFNIFGQPVENQAIALPFVIGNVLQGRPASEVTIDAMLGGSIWGERNAIASVTLAEADAVTGELFGASFTGLDFKAKFDPVAETVTVTAMGGPMGMVALSASTQTTPYNAVTLPEGATQRNVTYTDWDDRQVADTTHPVAKHIISLPYALNGDLFLPELVIESDTVALPTEVRNAMSTKGKAFSAVESAANTVTVNPSVDGSPVEVTVQTNLVSPLISESALTTAGYLPDNVYRFKREYAAVRITEPALIQHYKTEVANVGPDFLHKVRYSSALYTRVGSSSGTVDDILLGEVQLVTEGEEEVLYIPVPLYPNTAIGSHEYTINVELPFIGFQKYAGVMIKVNATFVAPAGLTAITQALEATQLDITALWTAATKVHSQTIYDVITALDRYSPLVPFISDNEMTSWGVNPNPGNYGYQDDVRVNGYNNAGSFGARLAAFGGLDRPVAGLNIVVLEGVTLPAEFEENQGPFKFLQVGNDVQILTWFDKLTLPKTTYPFSQLTPQYIAGFDDDSWNVRLTVAMDKTLLPAPILLENPSVMITSRFQSSFGIQTATFWHNFNSETTTQTISSAPKTSLPATVDLLPLQSRGVIVKKYEAIYVYEGTVGPAPTNPW